MGTNERKHEWGAWGSTREKVGPTCHTRRDSVEWVSNCCSSLPVSFATPQNCSHELYSSCQEGKDALGGFWGLDLLGCEMRPAIRLVRMAGSLGWPTGLERVLFECKR
eukprot:5071915-Prymnesium_polylepis.1